MPTWARQAVAKTPAEGHTSRPSAGVSKRLPVHQLLLVCYTAAVAYRKSLELAHVVIPSVVLSAGCRDNRLPWPIIARARQRPGSVELAPTATVLLGQCHAVQQAGP